MQKFRIFISSPGDADTERRRAENVVSRLNGEFDKLARLSTVRWETEHYRADETFQTQIPAAEACDVVVGILRWRLGTPLPQAFPDRLPDGEAYPSGTAYEILTSIAKRHQGAELPDVYVFRYKGGPPLVAIGDPGEEATRAAWAALGGFISRWFHTPSGEFVAAFNNYGSENDFEGQLETLLRKWLADKVAGGRVVPWPEIKRSPFRGLDVFGAKHAPVFFGRSADIRKAMDLWRDYAARGERILLIIGASGAGKSSLARAGLIPRLTTPGVIPEVDRWRVAAMRPGDSKADPFASLAAALYQTGESLPDEENGRGDALPEIAAGDFKTPAELAAVLAHADASAAQVLTRALDRIAEGIRKAEKFERPVRCDLVLLVDQLDELFAPSLTAETREAFARLLAALVASGRVWVITTLRADLYEPMLKVAALKALKDKGASYDLAPPGAAELAEIVREPAKAAALTFETDPKTGERLDERLLREADRPDMLPLVQLALSKLWEARVAKGSETILPLAAFEAQGGVKGIIEEAGRKALDGLGETERGRLAPLIRRLAALSRSNDGGKSTLSIRAVPLDEAAPDAASRRLVDGLVSARLLTLSGEGSASAVRLAHQRVLTDWASAAEIVTKSADFYRVRDEVEDRRRRWEAAGERGDWLLGRGLPLAEARAMIEKYGPELSDATKTYVAASRRRANRAQVIVGAAAAIFAMVAVAAGIEAKLASDRQAEANRQKQIAERNFGAAKNTVAGLIFNVAQGLQDVAGMRKETIRTILETVRKTVDGLLATAPDDAELLRLKSVMLNNFAGTYLVAGDLKAALRAAQESLDIDRKLAAQDQGNAEAQRDVSISLDRIGDVKRQAGDQAGALAAYQQDLAIAQKLAAHDPGNAQAQRDVSVSLDRIGDVKRQAGDQAGALAAYNQGLDIARKLAAQDQGNAKAQRDLFVSLVKIGDVKLQAGDQAGALAAYNQGLDIARKLAAQDQGNAKAQADLALSLERIGDVKLRAGDQAGALAAYSQSLDIRKKLAAQDQGNAQAQRDMSVSLERIGDVKLQAGDQAGALAAYQQHLDIARKLAAQDQGNAQAQRDVSVSLDRIGDVKRQAGDQAGALAAYSQSLDIRKKLAAQDQGNAEAQADLALSLESIGDVKLRAGDQAGALAAYSQSLDIRKKLAAQDQGNAKAQRDLFVSLVKIGDVKLQAGDQAGALAAYNQGLDIARKLAAQDQGNAKAQADLALSLERIGDVKLRAGDQAGALAAYSQSLDIRKKLAAQDQGNAKAQRDVCVSLVKIGDVKLQAGDQAGALAAYNQGLDIARKLAAQDQGNAQAQADLALSLERIGDVKLRAGDQAGALAAYQQSLDIRKKLAAQDQGNAKAQRDVCVSLVKIGDVKLQAGDQAGALAAYSQGLDIARKLAAQDQGNAEAQWYLVVSLTKVASVSETPASLYREALDIVEALDRSGRLAPSRKFAIEFLKGRLTAPNAGKP